VTIQRAAMEIGMPKKATTRAEFLRLIAIEGSNQHQA